MATGYTTSIGYNSIGQNSINGLTGNITFEDSSTIEWDINSSAKSLTPSVKAGLNANLIADGSVTNQDYQNIAGSSANLQLQIDALASGSTRFQAKAMATVNVDISNPATDTYDGITLNNGDSLFLNPVDSIPSGYQTAASDGGIYTFNGIGVALTRVSNMDEWDEVVGSQVNILQGTLWAGSTWNNLNVDGGTIDVTDITYKQIFTNLMISTINSQTKSANGAVIVGANLYMQTADSTYPGLLTSTFYDLLNTATYMNSPETLVKRAEDGSITVQQLVAVQVNNASANEINFLSGVTSAIQTQLDARLIAANNLSDLADASTARDNLGLGSAALLDAGTSTNNVVQYSAANTITVTNLNTSAIDNSGGDITIGANANNVYIGNVNAAITVLGSVENEQVTNLLVKDKLITLNDGGGSASGAGAGIEIEENGSITAYFKQNSSRTGFILTSSANAGLMQLLVGETAFTASISSSNLTANRTYNLPDADATMVQPSSAVSNQFITAISAAGVISRAQPSLSNLSDANSVVTLTDTQTLTNKTLTTPVLNGIPSGTGVSSSATANTLGLRDANANMFANNFISNVTSTVSSASPVTLTAASARYQITTGTIAQTYKMPNATTLQTGATYYFDNDSTQNVTVNDNSNTLITTVLPGEFVFVQVDNISSPAGVWDYHGLLPKDSNWGTGILNAINTTASFASGKFLTLVQIGDTDASHYMQISCGSNLTADRLLTITPGDVARTITLTGNPTLADWFDQPVKQAAIPAFAGLISPALTGGSGTTQALTLKSTSGVGTTGADIIFQAGNNGATEVMRLLNSGNVGVGTTSSTGFRMTISGGAQDTLKIASTQGVSLNIQNTSTDTIQRIYGTSGVNFWDFRASSTVLAFRVNDQTYMSVGTGTNADVNFTGNINFSTQGKSISYKEGGSAAMAALATLSNGTVTVSSTSVTAASRFTLTYQTVSGTTGNLSISARNVGADFTISGGGIGNNSTVYWEMHNNS
jgi:hypothetical protein